jgi:GTP cyclohydrolase II
MVKVRSRVMIPLHKGQEAQFVTFDGLPGGKEHFAVIFGAKIAENPVVRVHSECVTGDVFGSLRCDCGAQLHQAMDMMNSTGGILLYLRQEGRGIGLVAKLDAYRLQQEQGLDTYAANEALALPADAREYKCAALMLSALAVNKVRLLTNNPDKVSQIQNLGIDVVERLNSGTFLTRFNRRYLAAKAEITQHFLKV